MTEPILVFVKAVGEGSRGGHVVRHTASGAPVYAKQSGTGAQTPHLGKPAYDDETNRVIQDYKNFGYMGINEAARNYGRDFKEVSRAADKEPMRVHYSPKERREFQRSADVLSQAIAKNHLEKDTKLYRGMAVPKGVKVGDILTTHGFTSATSGKAVANGFAAKARRRHSDKNDTHESALATLHVPKGTPTLDFAKHAAKTGGEPEKEKEHLFDHRVQFRVVEDHGKGRGGHRHLTLEPIHPEEHAMSKSCNVAITLDKANKPLGAAFSHARKVAAKTGGGRQKEREVANRYLKKKGHSSMGKAMPVATFGQYAQALGAQAQATQADQQYDWKRYMDLFALNRANTDRLRMEAQMRQLRAGK